MPDILQDFPIAAAPSRVFEAISQPRLLDEWWTVRCSGRPEVGATYELYFEPDYEWSATVTRCVPNAAFELRMTRADDDWLGTTVGFELEPTPSGTRVRFSHRGWASANDHFRTSNHCWALYLRILRRHLEHGESVPYDDRLLV